MNNLIDTDIDMDNNNVSAFMHAKDDNIFPIQKGYSYYAFDQFKLRFLNPNFLTFSEDSECA